MAVGRNVETATIAGGIGLHRRNRQNRAVARRNRVGDADAVDVGIAVVVERHLEERYASWSHTTGEQFLLDAEIGCRLHGEYRLSIIVPHVRVWIRSH